MSDPGGPNLHLPAYLVQIDHNGTQKVHYYKQGFERLEFSHASSTLHTIPLTVNVYMIVGRLIYDADDRLFELGLATIGGTLPIRTIRSMESEADR